MRAELYERLLSRDVSPLSLALVTAVPVALLVQYARKRRSSDDVRHIPGPTDGHWLWGNEIDVFNTSLGATFTRWFNEYGPVVRFRAAFFHPDMLVIADPSAVHYMLTTNSYNFVKSPVFRPLVERLLGRGLVWAEGDHHKQQRRLLNGAFSTANVKSMAPDVLDAAAKLQTRLANVLHAQGGESTINVMHLTSTATLDIIGRVGFDHDFQGGQSPEAKDIQGAWLTQVNAGMATAAFYAQIVLRTFPLLMSVPVEAIKAQGHIREVVNRLSWQLVQSVQTSERERAQGKTLLSLMMKLNASGSDKMSMTQMIDNISTFVVVGHETTGSSLSMALHELAKNPEAQDTLRAELVALGREPTYDDLMGAALPYLDAVVKEGLRVHPPGPYMDRVALTDDVLPLAKPIITRDGRKLDSLRVRKGQVIHIPNVSINRLDAVWGDGRAFRPARWLEEGGLPPKSEMQHGWSNIMSFSEGPRLCVGYRSLLEYKAILAMLVRNFVFHDTGVEIECKFSSTMQMRVVGEEDKGVQLPLRITFA